MDRLQSDAPRPCTFGALLRQHRKAAGLSQEELAARAGVGVRTVRELERDAVPRPRRETLDLLAAALALPAAERAAFTAAARERATAVPAGHGESAVPPLVGRDRELALLERHLGGMGPPLLLLTGEPGIGKSRLLGEIARRAPAMGWRVLAGGCRRRDGQEPYAPLLEALERHSRELPRAQLGPALRGCAWLVRLLPELAGGPNEPLPAWQVSHEQERRLLFRAVERFLANVAGPAGTVLLLDDLQWAGPDALELLTALLRGGTAPLRVVGAYRDSEVAAPDPLTSALADLAQAGLVRHHTLTPLAPEDVQQLLAILLAEVGGDRAALAAHVARRAGGVPFFLVSCVQALGQDPTAGVEAIPWDVAQGIRQRVTALPAASQEVVRAAALAGGAVSPGLLMAVVEQTEPAVLAAPDAACRARLLLVEADGYRFAHDLIREVVEADAGHGRRLLLHRRIAEALEREAAGAVAEPLAAALAYHYGYGGEHAQAVRYLEQAGDQARARVAFGGAEAHYRELVARLDRLGRALDAVRAREKLGEVLWQRRRLSEGVETLAPAAETLRAAGDLEGLARVTAQIGLIHAHQGTWQEGVARLQPVLALVEGRVPAGSLAALQHARGGLFQAEGRFPEAVAALTRAADLARAAGELRRYADVQHLRAIMLGLMGRRDEAWPLLEEAGRAAEATGNLETLRWVLYTQATYRESRGELSAARQDAERSLAIAERFAHPAMMATALQRLSALACFAGDWEQAERDLARLQGLPDRIINESDLLELGRLRLVQGRWDEARAALEECSARARHHGVRVVDRVAESCLAELDLLAGRPAAALARLVPQLDRADLEEQVVTSHVLPALAWTYLELDNLEEAERTIAEALRRLRATATRLYLVDALRVRALVAWRRGHVAAAGCALTEGLDLARPMPYPYGEGRLLRVWALVHAQQGQDEPARRQLNEALAIFGQLGARKDVEQTEHLLATLS